MAPMGLTFAPVDLLLLFIVFGVPCLIVFGVIAIIVKLGNRPVAASPMQYAGMPRSAAQRFCMHCGSGLPAIARFCPSCGSSQDNE